MPQPTNDSFDVAKAVREAFSSASPAARHLIAMVLEIERRNQHLSRPRVQTEIEKAVRAAVAEHGSP